MKLAILSRNARLYSTQRLIEAARTRGHTVRVLDPLRCYLRIAPGDFEIHYKGRELHDYDAVLPRIGASVSKYGCAVLRQFEMMGAYTPNPSDAILRARDKLRAHQLLAREGIALPITVYGDNPDDTGDLLAMLGTPPYIVKLVEGAQGTGVILVEKPSAARSVIEAFRGLYANFLVQEFIEEARGADVRCLVVGRKVVAAMQRNAAPGDFRANLHRGGHATTVELSAEEIAIAIRACAAVGLGIAGVDLLRSNRGPLVLEVNSTPGLEGIEGATRFDVAGAIIQHIEQKVRRTRAAAPTPAPARRVARP
jgi:ribosomal protein S6--L-glutamate ligase